MFCFERYALSAKLPAIVRSLGERPCWHTHNGSFFTIELTDKNGEVFEYEIYFDVNRSSRKGWLNLVIKSAYVRTQAYASKQPRKRKIRLSVIAFKRQNKKPIKPGR